MKQVKWKSPVLWGAVGAQIVSILLLFGVIGGEQGELINNVIAGILQIFVLFGVLNNPNSLDSF
jgi:uncharacterized membrane protein